MKRLLLFWIWNDRIEPDEIRRQIADFHDKHVEGFFIHAMPEEFRPKDFPGGMPGYLSEHFFAMVKFAAECAKEYGMELWLYDEGGWPSGTMNGRLLAEHPELTLQHFLPTGEIVADPRLPDLLNPETTALFIRGTHEKYAQHLQKFFGNVIPGIFTDEPFFGLFEPDTRIPWSPVLEKRFFECKHYTFKECAMRIFGGDSQAKLDYCEVWSSLMADSFLKPLRQWCHDHRLLFSGHFNGDDLPKEMVRHLGGALFDLHSYFDIPGCDVIFRQLHALVPERDFSRITVSAAQGKPTISEDFAVYGADLSLAEMKQIAAMQFISGITVIAPMAFQYSTRNGRQVTTCADISGVDPRWENYAQFSDFVRRMSHVSDRTVPLVKCSVPFPVDELRAGRKEPEIFRQALALAEKQITYDYAPDALPVEGTLKSDLTLDSPCPSLRTRHMRSPRGERRMLVNAGITPLKCRFAAPAGFNVWYDPVSGKRTPAYADQAGMLTLELPFGGAMVLLTLHGRERRRIGASSCGERREIAFRQDTVVRAIRAGENGLREEFSIPSVPEKDMLCTIRYCAETDCKTTETAVLELPAARRKICTLSVNGKVIGTRLWGPYRWEIALKPGKNLLAVDVTGTPAQAVFAENHVQWLKEHGFMNSYFAACQTFPPLFPDENPLTGVFICTMIE